MALSPTYGAFPGDVSLFVKHQQMQPSLVIFSLSAVCPGLFSAILVAFLNEHEAMFLVLSFFDAVTTLRAY